MTTTILNKIRTDTFSIVPAQRRLRRPLRWIQRDRQALLILCYHGVSQSDEHEWDPTLYIEANLFRRRMQAIREFGYQVLPLQEAVERLRQGTLSGPTAVLTFDDGWQDFYSTAWRILKEFQFPATVYQTSYYSQYNRPVFGPISRYLLWKGRGRVVPNGIWPGGPALDLTTAAGMRAAARAVWLESTEKKLSAQQKDELLQRLASALSVDFDAILASRKLHLMNADEVREIAAAGIDVQLHTHRHRLPTDKRLFFRELEENRAWIEAASQAAATHFCYPNGEHRTELVSWLREAGIGCATTCDPGAATRHSDPLLLPRFTDASSISQAKFESWLTGTGRIAPAARRILRSMLGVPRRLLTPASKPEISTGTETSAEAVRTCA